MKKISIIFNDDTEKLLNKFTAKAIVPFVENGEKLPVSRLIQELVKAQISDIRKEGGTCIMGRIIKI